MCEKENTRLEMKATAASITEADAQKRHEEENGKDSKIGQREEGRRQLYTLVYTSYRI